MIRWDAVLKCQCCHLCHANVEACSAAGVLLAIAAASGAAVAWITRSLPTVAGSALVAVAAAVAGVFSKRGSEALDEGARLSLEMREKLLRDSHGRLPRVRDITDPVSVGVHRTAAGTTEEAESTTVPPFICRDKMSDLEEALSNSLLRGDRRRVHRREVPRGLPSCTDLPARPLVRSAGSTT